MGPSELRLRTMDQKNHGLRDKDSLRHRRKRPTDADKGGAYSDSTCREPTMIVLSNAKSAQTEAGEF